MCSRFSASSKQGETRAQLDGRTPSAALWTFSAAIAKLSAMNATMPDRECDTSSRFLRVFARGVHKAISCRGMHDVCLSASLSALAAFSVGHQILSAGESSGQTGPKMELVQTIKNGEGGVTKMTAISGIQFRGDYVYVSGSRSITYFKRNAQTGHLAYAGTVDVNTSHRPAC
jgi:hypothetical protein